MLSPGDKPVTIGSGPFFWAGCKLPLFGVGSGRLGVGFEFASRPINLLRRRTKGGGQMSSVRHTMRPRPATIVGVLAATIAAAVASVYIPPPWEIYSIVLSALGAAAFILSMTVRFQTGHRRAGSAGPHI